MFQHYVTILIACVIKCDIFEKETTTLINNMLNLNLIMNYIL